jgi:hypothetical protein
MDVNIKKNKIMILQKHNSKLSNLNFHIGNKNIDIVKEYTYLGLKLVPNGKFKIAQKQLCEKALHAFHKIRRKIDFHKLSPKTATKDSASYIWALIEKQAIWLAEVNLGGIHPLLISIKRM